jgi:hypothetical protein
MTVEVSKDELCSVGSSSSLNIARITSRIASVGITRVIPSRAASIVAIVDLPAPVAPPTRMTSGVASRRTVCHFAYRSAYRSPTSSRRTASVSTVSSACDTDPAKLSRSRSSITSATWNARAGARPVAMMPDAISPFEYGSPCS